MIATWNIIDGQGNKIEMACNRMWHHGNDLAILIETKLNGFHTVQSEDYNIVASKCTNQHQRGVALAHKESKNWHIESPSTSGRNVIKCTLVYKSNRTIVVGVYNHLLTKIWRLLITLTLPF